MFERVAIVGVGLIGGSLGLALHERRLARHIVGVGRNAASLDKALARHAIDSAATDFAEGVRDADLVVLATPIDRILTDLRRLPGLLADGAIVTDVGSTKGEIARAGDLALPEGQFVPGHPMAGSERSGVEAARPDLFIEATWAITPTPLTRPEDAARVQTMAMAVGARVLHLTPNDHDRAVAVTSHLPHVLAYALAAVAGDRAASVPHVFDLTAGSFASGTRVAHSDPALWREIAMSNRAALAEAIRDSRAEIDAVLAALESGDADAVEAAFRRGHRVVDQATEI